MWSQASYIQGVVLLFTTLQNVNEIQTNLNKQNGICMDEAATGVNLQNG